MCFVWTVRVMLGFEAYGCSLWIDNSILSFDGSGRDIASPEQLGKLLDELAPGTPWCTMELKDALSKFPEEKTAVLCGSLHMCGETLEYFGLNG